MTPLAIDLFCGLGGWTEGLLAENYRVIGFDIEQHIYGEHRYRAQLVLQDVRTLHGSQFRDAALIVASPPCQEFSWMAMPWSRGKRVAAALRGQGEFPDNYRGSRTVAELTALFDACFRIQREASEAAGRHIPMVIENVRGAQPWVGRARWAYGSFFLWGDVPALMPIQRYHQRLKVKEGEQWNVNRANYTGTRGWDEAVKVGGLDWNGYRNGDPDYRGQAFNPAAQGRAMQEARAIKNADGSWFNVAHNTTSGKGRNPDGRKVPGGGANGWFGTNKHHPLRAGYSKSPARKAASAMIAKIPETLARHIARTYHPDLDGHGSQCSDTV